MKYNSERISSLYLDIEELKAERENLIYLDIINCLHENGNCIKLERPIVLGSEEYYLPCNSLLLRDEDIVLSCVEDGEYTEFEGAKNISAISLSFVYDELKRESFIY